MIAVGVVEKPLVTDVVKAAESRKCAVEFYTKDGDAVERVEIKTFDVVERLLSLDNDGDGKRDLCDAESFEYFNTFFYELVLPLLCSFGSGSGGGVVVNLGVLVLSGDVDKLSELGDGKGVSRVGLVFAFQTLVERVWSDVAEGDLVTAVNGCAFDA